MITSAISSSQKRRRTTAEQLSRMVEFLMETPGLAGPRFQKLHGKSECDKNWGELATMLNSLGGAVKNVDQWRPIKVWRELKSRTSIKIRDRKKRQAMTGSNPINEESLTELERRVIALVGNDYVQSYETVPVEEELQLRLEEGEESLIIELPSFSNETSSEMRASTPITPAKER